MKTHARSSIGLCAVATRSYHKREVHELNILDVLTSHCAVLHRSISGATPFSPRRLLLDVSTSHCAAYTALYLVQRRFHRDAYWLPSFRKLWIPETSTRTCGESVDCECTSATQCGTHANARAVDAPPPPSAGPTLTSHENPSHREIAGDTPLRSDTVSRPLKATPLGDSREPLSEYATVPASMSR